MPTNRMADLQLRGRTGTLQGRVYWPGQATARPARLLVYCAVADASAWCLELSASAGLAVLSVPCVRKDPADLEDAITAAEWAAEHAAALDADPGQLLIGGDGAGGTLAAAAARHAHALGWPQFRRQVLICAGPAERTPASLRGLPPATVVTVQHDPAGDDGRYAALLRSAGVAVNELHYPAADPASAVRIRAGRQLRADVSAALNVSAITES